MAMCRPRAVHSKWPLTVTAPYVSLPLHIWYLTIQIFLSSNETQEVVNALWSGRWVQENNEDQDIDYVEYHRSPDRAGSFWDHLDPLRLSVPRYQSLLRVIIWLVYLFVYSQSVKRWVPHV